MKDKKFPVFGVVAISGPLWGYLLTVLIVNRMLHGINPGPGAGILTTLLPFSFGIPPALIALFRHERLTLSTIALVLYTLPGLAGWYAYFFFLDQTKI